jgi:hypothetical protein
MSQSTATTDDVEAVRILISRILLGVHTSMPGIIVAFNLDGDVPTATVRPAIQQIVTIGNAPPTYVDLPDIPNVPLVLPYAQKKGLSITIPISEGDECMLHFAERSIDHWHESGGVQPPVESRVSRKHDYHDAICVPGAISKLYPIVNYSTEALEVRNADGLVALSVLPDSIEMRAGAESIFMPGDGNIYITGNIIQTGSFLSSIGFSTPGFITALVATFNGILFSGHKHTNVNNGPNTSGGPTN